MPYDDRTLERRRIWTHEPYNTERHCAKGRCISNCSLASLERISGYKRGNAESDPPYRRGAELPTQHCSSHPGNSEVRSNGPFRVGKRKRRRLLSPVFRTGNQRLSGWACRRRVRHDGIQSQSSSRFGKLFLYQPLQAENGRRRIPGGALHR